MAKNIVENLEVTTPDNRTLAVESTGDVERGYPVFLMHGTPGSRIGIKPRDIVLYRMGIHLISYDRPGYGGSTRQEGRSVVDCAEDVQAIATRLELGRFAVVGRSGGGPHVLACAARLGSVVDRVAVMGSIAPNFKLLEGMARSNIELYGAEEDEALAGIRDHVAKIKHDPDNLLKILDPDLHPADRSVVDDIALRRLLHASYEEAVAQGSGGWEDDHLAFRKPWGFQLSEITVPVDIWHGKEDTFSPVEHAHTLKKGLVNSPATLIAAPDQAHFNTVEVLPDILASLVPEDFL